MAKFKPGDVVLCKFSGSRQVELPVIVGNKNPWPGMITVGAIFEEGQWTDMRDGGSWEEANTRIHPDPDSVWADFCKWKLTKCP